MNQLNCYRINREQSSELYCLRGIAMYFVVCAHCTYEFSSMQYITSILGLIGVPILFALSGFFVDVQSTRRRFWEKKLFTIIIPWILWGIITYIIHSLSDKTFSIIELLNWIMGFNTWLYFVPVLIMLLAIFRLIANHDCLIVLGIVLSITSNILTINKTICFKFITPYQNPFNWMLFFAIGVLIKRKGLLDCLLQRSSIFIPVIIVSLGMVIIYLKFNSIPYYWTNLSIPFELACVIIALYSTKVLRYITLLIDVGKKSYPIYFLHMQIGTNFIIRIKALFNLNIELPIIAFIQPGIVLLFTYLLVASLKYLCDKYKADFISKSLAL